MLKKLIYKLVVAVMLSAMLPLTGCKELTVDSLGSRTENPIRQPSVGSVCCDFGGIGGFGW